MKKLFLTLLVLVSSSAFSQQAHDLNITQRRSDNGANIARWIGFPAGNAHALLWFDGATTLPKALQLGTNLSVTSGVLNAGSVQPDWNCVMPAPCAIANQPSFATLAFTGSWDDIPNKPALGTASALNAPASGNAVSGEVVKGNDTRLTDARTPTAHTHPASQISDATTVGRNVLTAADAAAARAAIGAGTGNGSGTVTSVACGTGLSGGTITTTGGCALSAVFNFSQPSAKTVAVNTTYQAADPTKAAIIVPSFACQNATQVLASSACTLQVRMSASPMSSCSDGTVYYTQSLTVALGVLLTQNSTNPVQINLPIGGYFRVCPTAGTFTVTAVEQVAAFN